MNVLSRLFSRPSSLFKKAAAPPPPAMTIPAWYRPHPSAETLRLLAGDKPIFLYLPWIAEHTDALISRLGASSGYDLAPFDLFASVGDDATRRDMFRFAQEEAPTYRRLVARRLMRMRARIRGVIFTFDWPSVTRIVANVCEELEIPRILIPHESVFVSRDKYYWDPVTQASVPVADVVLGWGKLQQEIFLERGYPAERFRIVGAPKFDPYANYRPSLTRAQFCRLYGLRPDRKLIVFATQPLDSQLDMQAARTAQRRAVADVLAFAQANGCQLLVRLPPSKDDVLGPELRVLLANSLLSAVDDALCYLAEPEEVVHHADVVSSVNSTMLFEAALLGRPALAMKYVEFDQVWEKVGIPAARDRQEMDAKLTVMLTAGWSYPPEGLAWAADMFGVGAFDGRASARISAFLAALAADAQVLELRPDPLTRLFARERIDVVAVPPVAALSPARQPHLLGLLNARTRVESAGGAGDPKTLAAVDLFVRWGADGGAVAQALAARALGRPVAVLEHGLVGAPGTSLILDDTTAYYDATTASRLERWLAEGPELTTRERARARHAIDRIVARWRSQGDVSPAPDNGRSGARRVLVVDQEVGDPAVTFGLADGDSFARMMRDVVAGYGDCDIIVRKHPDPAGTGTVGYLAGEVLASASGNVRLVDAGSDPHALLAAVDEVFVVTSNLGFDALMAGRKVRCYGAPFYAGWGLTEDRVPVTRRNRARTIEDVFFAACITHARYYDPRRKTLVEIEDVIEDATARD
ncbi:capsular polysaccharide export protein, LipB/KpsS family [Xanthobacter sediminis]